MCHLFFSPVSVMDTSFFSLFKSVAFMNNAASLAGLSQKQTSRHRFEFKKLIWEFIGEWRSKTQTGEGVQHRVHW